MQDLDVLVIGAGMSGLAAGIRLAQFGKRVCVVDQQLRPGGMNTYYLRRGKIVETGLHALTNWPEINGLSSPWRKILRQLRVRDGAVAPAPQFRSRIIDGQISISFSNSFEELCESVARTVSESRIFQFADNALLAYESLDQPECHLSARKVLTDFFGQSPVVDLLFLPVAGFGTPTEEDMPFGVFCMLFRSIFLEGLWRPVGGIKAILDSLTNRLMEAGGQLELGWKIESLCVKGNKVERARLAKGSEISAKAFVSTIGWPETAALCEWASDASGDGPSPPTGKISFVEVIAELSRPPAECGFEESLVFYRTDPRVGFKQPAGLFEPGLGVICAPANFAYPNGPASDIANVVRLTCLGAFDSWYQLPQTQYQAEKMRAAETMLNTAAQLGWDFRTALKAVDVTTPVTLARYTGRLKGAVYGSPEKCWDGRTHLENLYIAGTDQGMPGVVGALLSGIVVVNRHLLRT